MKKSLLALLLCLSTTAATTLTISNVTLPSCQITVTDEIVGHVYQLQSSTNFLNWDEALTYTDFTEGPTSIVFLNLSAPVLFFRLKDVTNF